jgi:quercetin dioxygenase-like cupin family protein
MSDHTFVPNWQERIKYAPDGPHPQVLSDVNGFKVVLGGLEPGQKIPLHPEGAGAFYFIDGTGWMLVEDERLRVQPGSIVVAPAGSRRGMEAETRLAFFAARVA